MSGSGQAGQPPFGQPGQYAYGRGGDSPQRGASDGGGYPSQPGNAEFAPPAPKMSQLQSIGGETYPTTPPPDTTSFNMAQRQQATSSSTPWGRSAADAQAADGGANTSQGMMVGQQGAMYSQNVQGDLQYSQPPAPGPQGRGSSSIDAWSRSSAGPSSYTYPASTSRPPSGSAPGAQPPLQYPHEQQIMMGQGGIPWTYSMGYPMPGQVREQGANPYMSSEGDGMYSASNPFDLHGGQNPYGSPSESPPSAPSYMPAGQSLSPNVGGSDEWDENALPIGSRDRRRAQNKIAQRAFRERAKVQAQEDKDHMIDLESLTAQQAAKIHDMGKMISQLRKENDMLRAGGSSRGVQVKEPPGTQSGGQLGVGGGKEDGTYTLDSPNQPG